MLVQHLTYANRKPERLRSLSSADQLATLDRSLRGTQRTCLQAIPTEAT